MEFSNRSSLRTQRPQRERKALIAAARTLASALEQRPFFTFEARGYGSLRSQGRPLRDYTRPRPINVGSIQSYAIPRRLRGRVGVGVLTKERDIEVRITISPHPPRSIE